MKTPRKTWLWCAGWLVAVALFPAPLLAQTASNTLQPAQTHRDGQHDFDFNFGTWHTHIKRLQHPLSGSSDWTDMQGTVTVRKIWNGKGSLEEIEASGPDGRFE